MDLTYKQRLFVAYYLGESKGNATDAARKAGYSSPDQQGRQQLLKTKIRAAVDAKLNSVAMSSDEVLARLSEIASGSLGSFIEFTSKGGWSIDLKKARKAGKLGLIRKLKPTEDGVEVELHSPMDALDKLAKYHGLYEPKGDKTAKPLTDLVAEAEAKGKARVNGRRERKTDESTG